MFHVLFFLRQIIRKFAHAVSCYCGSQTTYLPVHQYEIDAAYCEVEKVRKVPLLFRKYSLVAEILLLKRIESAYVLLFM
jgi:hypothetical protein